MAPGPFWTVWDRVKGCRDGEHVFPECALALPITSFVPDWRCYPRYCLYYSFHCYFSSLTNCMSSLPLYLATVLEWPEVPSGINTERLAWFIRCTSASGFACNFSVYESQYSQGKRAYRSHVVIWFRFRLGLPTAHGISLFTFNTYLGFQMY